MRSAPSQPHRGDRQRSAAKRASLFHTDAVQAVGHIEIDVEAMNIDMLSHVGP